MANCVNIPTGLDFPRSIKQALVFWQEWIGGEWGCFCAGVAADRKVVLGWQFTLFNGKINARLARVLATDPPPAPALANIAVAGSDVVLNWAAAKNEIYRVDYTQSLTVPNWVPLFPYITGLGTNMVVTNNTGGAAQRWYRVAFLSF